MRSGSLNGSIKPFRRRNDAAGYLFDMRKKYQLDKFYESLEKSF